MKVYIDEVRLVDSIVHIRYIEVASNTSGRVRLPIAGFDNEWIAKAIKRDLSLKRGERVVFEEIHDAFMGKELEIVEDEP